MTHKQRAELLWPEIAKRFSHACAGSEGAVKRLLAREFGAVAKAAKEAAKKPKGEP